MGDMEDMEDHRKTRILIATFAGAVSFLVGMDLVNDYQQGSSGRHLILEGLLLALSGSVFIGVLIRGIQTRQEVTTLRQDLEKYRAERDQWKTETSQLMEGLSVKIDDQFAKWKLTQAETEVGFLLLKGLSLKEIADIRGTKIKTVQQQSQSIYQKTDLGSRSELAAFFLEDLLPSRKLGENN